jgi:SAM-dependent methyltransferase
MVERPDQPAAEEFAAWERSARGRRLLEIEDRVARELIAPRRGERVLDVGCGTGRWLADFRERGLFVTGLDLDPDMVDLARRRLGPGADVRQGAAEDLPFEDNAFDLTCLNTVLEFAADPEEALREAVRVTLGRLYLGVLNPYSFTAAFRRLKGLVTDSVYRRADFISPWKLKAMIARCAGPRPVRWRSVFTLPLSWQPVAGAVEGWSWMQRSPFGAYVGLVAEITITTRTANLELKADVPRRANPALVPPVSGCESGFLHGMPHEHRPAF